MAKIQNSFQDKVEYYANLPYTITVEREDDHFAARVIELPDLIMTGDNPEEAVAELEAVKKEWIAAYLELGNKMPQPLKSRKYSGKVVLRMPPSLHESLVKIAEIERVSFNQYMVFALSKHIGHRQTTHK